MRKLCSSSESWRSGQRRGHITAHGLGAWVRTPQTPKIFVVIDTIVLSFFLGCWARYRGGAVGPVLSGKLCAVVAVVDWGKGIDKF